jgi:thiosulfate dehydrogenase (quinone) large subunit
MNPSRWRTQSLRSWPLAEYALLPLRAFLGFTFLFAGLQKLANPGFFDANNSASIQAQLVAASTHSPIGIFVSHLVEHATFIGAVVALGEVAIGIGTILGLWTRIAALGGMALSIGLFLTVSFHANPYYTGSDLVFAFAWIPFIMAGAGTHLSWDARIARQVARERKESGTGLAVDGAAVASSRLLTEVDRRTVVVGAGAAAAVAAMTAILAAASAGLGRALGGVKSSKPPTQLTTTTTTALSGTTSTTIAGTEIGAASQVAVGGSAMFTIPSSQEPGIILQPTSGNFVAYNAVCPHAGCTVNYYKSNDALVCPCHTSIFKVSDGSLVSGPSPTGLATLNVVERNGNLYLE